MDGYYESFNAKLRDEMLNGEISYTLKEAKIIIENRRQHYSTAGPHSSLSYKPPALNAAVRPRQNGPASATAVTNRPSMHQHFKRNTQWEAGHHMRRLSGPAHHFALKPTMPLSV
ncbi:integrase core domain-containing protein [Brucella sp. LJL56]